MVYTYDNILEEARKAGVLEKFSQEDHNAAQKNPEYGMSLVGLLKDANNATTETQRLLATETVNQLRKSYGVTGATGVAVGSSFSDEQRLVAPKKNGTLASSDSATYQMVLDDIVNQKEFTYDHEQDPAYQSYAKTYLREGARASENALAQAAAMSGGRPSSYALSVAQQTGNQYAAALADMIPTLRQNALTEYQNDIAAKYDILSALDAERQTEYQKVLDEENRKRLEVQDALTKYQALGYATSDIAQILGIPEGTKYGETPQTGETVNGGTSVPIGSALDLLLKGTQQKTPEEEAVENARAIASGILNGINGTRSGFSGVGSGIQSTLTGTETGNTGTVASANADGASEPGEPIITNPMGGSGKNIWIQLSDGKISLEALEREVLAGRIVGKYDASSNTVTYERVSLPTAGKGR